MVAQIDTIEQDAPLLITVHEAERLCSIPYNGGYQLVKDEWAPFVVKYGKGGRGAIRINRQKLIEWANGRVAA